MNGSDAPSRPLSVLVIERDPNGHRFMGVRVLLEALLALEREAPGRLGTVSFAATAAGFASEEHAVHLGDLDGRVRRVELAPAPTGAGPLGAAREKLDDWRAHARGGAHDHVYVPYGDGLVQLLGIAARVPGAVSLPRAVEAETILMRGSFGYPDKPPRTRALALHGLRRAPFARVHLIDALARAALDARPDGPYGHVRLMPDPITPTEPLERSEARAALGLDPDPALRWCGCVGLLDERKGIDRLVGAFSGGERDPHARLLLAGRHAPEVRAAISDADDPRIVSRDGFLEEADLERAIGALDLLVTPYPRFVGSVSLVVRAASAQRPVLGARTGWMGHVIPRFGLGATCDVERVETLRAALIDALGRARAHAPGAGAEAFADYCRTDNARAHWTARLRERLGLAQDPALRPWPEGAS